MFGIKLSRNGKSRTAMIKESVEQGSEMMNEKLSEGVKVAEEKMEMVKNYLEENQEDIEKVGKISGLAVITLAGVGLIAYGVYALMKELD